MAESARRPAPETQPSGVEGEGLDPYPTYRDGPQLPHNPTSTKPTDVGLPQASRTSSVPMLVGLIVFALVIVGLIAWASVRTATTSEEGLAPPESPPAAEAAATSDDGAMRETDPNAQTGPGEIGEAPGPAEVPGGDAATPVSPEPAQ